LAIASSSGKQVQLPGDVRVERRFRELLFFRISDRRIRLPKLETDLSPIAYQYEIELPAQGNTSVSVPELGTCFSLKVVDWPFTESETKQGEEPLDVELLRAPLILRNWHPGDAYRPAGRVKSRKLSRMFMVAQIPADKRSGWPVLESGGQVVWSRGMRPAHGFSAGSGTRVGLMIEERRL